MTDILLRDIDERLDKALRILAVEHGRTREAEIKSILESAVSKNPRKRAFSEVLMAIPQLDADIDDLFRRPESGGRQVNLG
jgi:plasmid stability protein